MEGEGGGVNTEQLVEVGRAVQACYDPFFLDRPERAIFPTTLDHGVIWGTDDDGPRPYGVVYENTALAAWVVAIRGTDSTCEWVSDATAALVPCPFMAGAQTHAGFTRIFSSLVVDGKPLAPYVAGLATGGRVIVAGHSLGAALATLVAVAAGGVDLVTFAGPRVGDDGFVAGGLARLASNTRVVNQPDVVPKVPFRLWPIFPYGDFGAELALDSGGQVKPDIHAWHDLLTYLHLLDPKQPLDPQHAA